MPASSDNLAPPSDKSNTVAHTPGPWRWEINLSSRQLQLCGGDPKGGFGAYDHTVMDFVRWGMSGAQPRFLDAKKTLLTEASTYAEVVEGREHHKAWFQTLSHPDARLIAASPCLFKACKEIDGEAPVKEPSAEPTIGPSPGWRTEIADEVHEIVREAFEEGKTRGRWEAAQPARQAILRAEGGQ